jgi:hypothetical protein
LKFQIIVHEWKSYNNDDAPVTDGVAAGLYDVDNMAYVGKGFNDIIDRVARIQVTEPGKGLYMSKSGLPFFQQSGGFYLYNNPNYDYHWVDATSEFMPSNIVRIKIGGPQSLDCYAGRLQVDGQTQVSLVAHTMGMFFFDGNTEKVSLNYQVLACTPKPAYQCSKFRDF